MGQILKRIADLAKANWNNRDEETRSAEHLMDSVDDDFKKQFENLGQQQHSDQRQQSVGGGMDRVAALRTLGLAANPTADEIKQAYKLRVSEYHPDKTAHLGAEIRELAEKKILQINLAYDFLKKSMEL